MPLYRYQRRLRLARALDLISQYDDLTTLGLDLGFSSHSHFTAAFREVYGYLDVKDFALELLQWSAALALVQQRYMLAIDEANRRDA